MLTDKNMEKEKNKNNKKKYKHNKLVEFDNGEPLLKKCIKEEQQQRHRQEYRQQEAVKSFDISHVVPLFSFNRAFWNEVVTQSRIFEVPQENITVCCYDNNRDTYVTMTKTIINAQEYLIRLMKDVLRPEDFKIRVGSMVHDKFMKDLAKKYTSFCINTDASSWHRSDSNDEMEEGEIILDNDCDDYCLFACSWKDRFSQTEKEVHNATVIIGDVPENIPVKVVKITNYI
mgnify:CR=1 FL=1